MVLALVLSLLPLLVAPEPQSLNVSPLWSLAVSWQTFLDDARANREQWLRNWSRAEAPGDLTARLRRSGGDVRLLIVAEDWCPDSVNTVPYIVKLADAAGIETRILNRAAGAPLMDRHRAFDGRRVTPLVVVVRGGRDAGAWIERPAVLQDLFRAMASDPEKARRFGQRQAWYDEDAGRTTDREIVELVERGGQTMTMTMPMASVGQPADPGKWHLHFDGVVFGTFNDQAGPRGKTQFRSQNWGMGMASRQVDGSTITLSVMMSAEPLTVGSAGYSELFQEGEAYHGLQVTDRQHPHNLFMQLAAWWRIPVTEKTFFTIAGGPVGEAALGPVAFMHRPSSSENPTAPLSHHIFDSTHLTNGVVLGGIEHGAFTLEGSVFHGREPGEDRYAIDLGTLDSWSVRGWFRPSPAWTIQISHGFLHQPEQLEPGNQRRTNGSVSWLRQRGSNYTAFTFALGRTLRTYSLVGAVLAEGTEHVGRTSIYGRFERVSVETEILLFPEVVHHPHPGELVDPIIAYTAGGIRDVGTLRGLVVGLGSDVTLDEPPPLLQITHGPHPISFHIFVRIARPPGQRMWDMTMGSDSSMPAHHEM